MGFVGRGKPLKRETEEAKTEQRRESILRKRGDYTEIGKSIH